MNKDVWFPEDLTRPDYPSIDITRALSINPNADWKIVIWRPRGGIGDMLMLTPTFQALKRELPNSHITLVTSFEYLSGVLVDILDGNPYIDEIVDVRSWDHNNQADILINEADACVSEEIPGAFPPNRINMFASKAGVRIEDEKVFYKVKPQELENAADFALQRRMHMRDHIFLYQPFASSIQRSPEIRQNKRILSKIHKRWPNSMILVPTHATDWGGDVDFNLIGCEQLKNYNIRLLASIMYETVDVVICPDSSLLHLAGALEKPTVALFGPTPSQCRIDHYPKVIGIDAGKGICKGRWPCWYSQCQFGKICWKSLEDDVIINAIERALKGDFTTAGPKKGPIAEVI